MISKVFVPLEVTALMPKGTWKFWTSPTEPLRFPIALEVFPRKPFDARANSWGAFEIAVRYARLEIDDAAFPLFADPSTSASEAAGWAVGLNWYLNKILRASVDFFHTDFEGGRAGDVTRQDENAISTRLQLAF